MNAEIVRIILGSLLVYLYGLWRFERGKAYGWQEGYFQRQANEKARRDAQGRFK